MIFPKFSPYIGLALIAIFGGILGMFLFDGVERFSAALGCKSVPLRLIPSPSQGMTVVVFEEECGATTGFNTQAVIRRSKSTDLIGREPAFLVLDGRHDLRIIWKNSNLVEVELPSGAEIYKQDQLVKGIQIEYK